MTTADVLRQLRLDRLMFSLAYRRQRTPWDTRVTPPELVAEVEGPRALSPGRALDLGCGTGTNVLYLARAGWDATGIDFAAPAVERASRRIAEGGPLPGVARVVRGDATRLERAGIEGPFMLLFDLGCLHGIADGRRAAYAAGLARLAAPGARYMLYAFSPRMIGRRRIGITEAEVRALFAPAFQVERVVSGTDTGRGVSSAWYWLRRDG